MKRVLGIGGIFIKSWPITGWATFTVELWEPPAGQ